MANRALAGNAWTGALEKREVSYAVRRLIQVAEELDRECQRLRETSNRRSR
jgi:hypothetical protein